MGSQKSEEERKGRTRSMAMCCTTDCDISVRSIEGYQGEIRCQNCWHIVTVGLQSEITALKKRVEEMQNELEGRDVFEEANTSLACDCTTLQVQLNQAQAKIASCKCDSSEEEQDKDRNMSELEEKLGQAKEKLIEQGIQLQRGVEELNCHRKALGEMKLSLQHRSSEYVKSLREGQDEIAALRAQLEEYMPKDTGGTQRSWAGITGNKGCPNKTEMPGRIEGGNRDKPEETAATGTKTQKRGGNEEGNTNKGDGSRDKGKPKQARNSNGTGRQARADLDENWRHTDVDESFAQRVIEYTRNQRLRARGQERAETSLPSRGQSVQPGNNNRSESRTALEKPQQVSKGSIQHEKKNLVANRFAGREKIIIVGDHMVKFTDKVVGLKEEGSSKICLPGAGIREVMTRAVDAAKKAHDNSKIFISAGGNGLRVMGVEWTVNAIVDGLKTIGKVNNQLYAACLGIIRCPRESEEYERMRCEVNSRVKVIIRTMIEEGERVMFLDTDRDLRVEEHFGRDRVHLNRAGVGKLGMIIRSGLYNKVIRNDKDSESSSE